MLIVLPTELDRVQLFVHRVGRVARAGRSGTAYSLADKSELPYMLELLKYANKRIILPPLGSSCFVNAL